VYYSNRGYAYLDLGRTQSAINDLSEAIRLNPKFGKALANRGLAYTRADLLDKALVDLDNALRIGRSAIVLRWRAAVYSRMGRTKDALMDLDEAVRLGEHLPESYFARAHLRSEMGDAAGAMEDAKALVAAVPDEPDSYFSYARYCVLQERYDEAIANVDRAISINPKAAFPFEFRGSIWICRGDSARGLSDIDTAIRMKADDLAAKFSDPPKQNVTPEDMAHGREQVARMLHDRPEMARYRDRVAPLEEWAARKFAGEDFGHRIFWDPAEPPLGTFGLNNPGSKDRHAIICVSKNVCSGKRAGTPQSFDELWSGTVFELYNICNASGFEQVDAAARIGTVTRWEYVARILELECGAAQKTRAFYIRVFLPWAMREKVPSHPNAWYLGVTSTFRSQDVEIPQRLWYASRFDQIVREEGTRYEPHPQHGGER